MPHQVLTWHGRARGEADLIPGVAVQLTSAGFAKNTLLAGCYRPSCVLHTRQA